MNSIDLFKRTIPLISVTAYFCKLLFLSASFTDVGVLAILAGLFAYLEWRLDKNEILKHKTRIEALEKRITEVDAKVSTLKTTQNFKTVITR